MRKIGIDFGTKKVGLALTDESGNMAFPHAVVPNDASLLQTIVQLIVDKNVTAVVIGQSLDLDGSPNPVQQDIDEFITDLTLQTPIPIHLQPEQFTSQAAARETGKNDQVDAAAAALILDSYIQLQTTKATVVEADRRSDEDEESVPEITFDQFIAVEIKIGTILAVAIVEDADKLLRLTVDLGESEPRQIVSGIREFFPDEQELVGRQCPFIANLAPRKIRGLVSQGMILAGNTDDTFALLHPSNGLPAGTRLY